MVKRLRALEGNLKLYSNVKNGTSECLTKERSRSSLNKIEAEQKFHFLKTSFLSSKKGVKLDKYSTRLTYLRG